MIEQHPEQSSKIKEALCVNDEAFWHHSVLEQAIGIIGTNVLSSPIQLLNICQVVLKN